jgi:hypothetical protein
MTNKTITVLIGVGLITLPLVTLAQGLPVNTNAAVQADVHVAGDGTSGRADTDAGAGVKIKAQANIKATVGVDMLSKAKEHADKEIDRRIDGLTKLSTRISNATHISAEGKTGITGMVTAQITELQSLKTKVDGEASTTALKDDIQSITKSYRIYALVMPQLALTAAADRVVDVADAMNGVAGKLEARLGADAAASSTVSGKALADMKAKIASAQQNASDAVNSITSLQPDNGDKTVAASNLAALKAARAKIQAAQADAVAARKDMKTILAELKISVNTSAGASATTTATTTP